MEGLCMEEKVTYKVEREFLDKITVEDLVKRIIQMHQEEECKKAV